MLDTKEIIDFFTLEQSHAKKELGQNFLINKKVCEDIVNLLSPLNNEKVLEIGPGLGALTDILIKKNYDLTCVEYDAKFVNYLNLAYGKCPNIKIIKNNIIKEKEVGFDRVIGNLPYYMTTEIISFITTKDTILKECVFMVQKECYLRLTSLEGKDFNGINVYLKYMFNINACFDVKKNNFFPVPSVDSIVFKMVRKEDSSLQFGLKLYKVANCLFINRRKTILNNLNMIVKNKENTAKIISECNLKENCRAEQLTINDFINLTNILIQDGYIR